MSDDLIERLRDQASHLELGMATPLDTTAAAKHLIALSYEAAGALSEMRAELEQSEAKRKELLDRCWRLNTRAEAAEAQLEQMKKALEPFAREAEVWGGYDEAEALVEGWQGGPASQLTVAHLRAAARALSQDEPADLGVGG